MSLVYLYVQLEYFLFIQAIFEHICALCMRHNEDTKKHTLEILPLRGFALEEGQDMYIN